MTTKQLDERVSVGWIGTCQYRVEITFRGKAYTCRSNNSLAWDDMDREPGDSYCYYTRKQALQAFYDECCQKNHLGKYNH